MVQTHIAGSSSGTTAVVVTSSFVNASMICQLQDEFLSVVWFVYQGQYVLSEQVSHTQDVYLLKRNGQKLQIKNMALQQFLMSSFECRLQSSPGTSGSIPVTNFTTVGIPGTDYKYPTSSGMYIPFVKYGYRSSTNFRSHCHQYGTVSANEWSGC